MIESGLNKIIDAEKSILELSDIKRYWQPITDEPYLEAYKIMFSKGIGYIDPAIERRFLYNEEYDTGIRVETNSKRKLIKIYLNTELDAEEDILKIKTGDDYLLIHWDGDIVTSFSDETFLSADITYNDKLITIDNIEILVDHNPVDTLTIEQLSETYTIFMIETFDITDLSGGQSLDMSLALWGAGKHKKFIFNTDLTITDQISLPNYETMFNGEYKEILSIDNITYKPYSEVYKLLENGDILLFKQNQYYHSLFMINVVKNQFAEISAQITLNYGKLFNGTLGLYPLEDRFNSLSQNTIIKLIKMK